MRRFPLSITMVALCVLVSASIAHGQIRRLPATTPDPAPWTPAPTDTVIDTLAYAPADEEPTYTPADRYFPLEAWYEGCDDGWCWQVLPDGIIYKTYLAGVKESRLSANVLTLRRDGTMLDGTLGGKFGLFRYGNQADVLPQGYQFDIEASAHVRLDIPSEVDVRSSDYRAGATLTSGIGRHQWRFGYYHLSSHLGDEFLLKNMGYPRLNYARDVLILGYGYYLTDNLRIYGEAGWAFWEDVAENWEFQFGLDYAPAFPTGFRGAPFLALNGHLRQELNYGGHFVFQTGWAWRSDDSGQLFRIGLQYFNGKSNQYSFYNVYEEQFGFGIWYDF